MIMLINLLRSLATVSLITIFSRLLGFVRDAIIARVFGAGVITDAFFIAFKLPNFLRRIFAEGAFLQAFVPILTEYKNKKSKKTTRIFIAYVSGMLTLLLLVITVMGILLAPRIIMLTAPGFVTTNYEFVISSQLLRIIFPYIILISLTSLVSAILNTWNYFSIPAFAPILLNITMITFSLLIAPYFNHPILSLAWAIIVSGILQLAYQLPFLKKIDMLVLPRINFRDNSVLKVVKQMIPAILSVSVNQISLVINTAFASFLVSGSISWIYYADRLMEFPCGVLGVSLSTIMSSSLSKSFANGDYNEYCRIVDWGLRLCFLLALPSAIALGILAKALIASLFQYGNFTDLDVLMTTKALIAYSIGLLGIIIVKVLASGFYSCHNTKTPAKITIVTLVVTQFMNLIFVGPLKHTGLSLSVSIAACLNAVLLYKQLRKQNIFVPQSGWINFLSRLVIAVSVMAISLIWMLYQMPNWSLGSMFYRMLHLLLVVLVGVVTYFTMLAILGFRIKDFIYRAKI